MSLVCFIWILQDPWVGISTVHYSISCGHHHVSTRKARYKLIILNYLVVEFHTCRINLKLKGLNNLPVKWIITVMVRVLHTTLVRMWVHWDILQTLVTGLLSTILCMTSSYQLCAEFYTQSLVCKIHLFLINIYAHSPIRCLSVWESSLVFSDSFTFPMQNP
jgi:hypothetical protein